MGQENAALSGLADRPIRYITDDVFKFVQRERGGEQIRCDHYGPSVLWPRPSGETWKLEQSLYPFLESRLSIVSDNPLFMLINSYTTGISLPF